MTDDTTLRAEAQIANPDACLPVVLAAIEARRLLVEDESVFAIDKAAKILFDSLAPFDGLHAALRGLQARPRSC
jgi:hypothetical protein